MKQVVYYLQFKGNAAPRAGAEGVIGVTAKAGSASSRTSILPDGLEGRVEPLEGTEATFESSVTMTGTDSFDEKGSISFGDGGNRLRFSTVGQGFVGPSPEPGVTCGAVVWKVEGGDGVFDGASGLITSNFSFTAAGEVIDNQVGVLYLR